MNYQSLPIQLLPGIPQIVAEHEQAGQQPDNLCGPYWVAILLRSYGISVTPDQVAQQAGSVLPLGDPTTWLPQGATSRQTYSVPLPATDCLKDAGTSAHGLMRSVAILSQGAYTLLPVQTDWTADRLLTLIQLCQEHPDWAAIPLCNLKTDHLWGSHLSIDQAIGYLDGQSIQPPAADWHVGHFLILAGTIKGSVQTLLWLCDTYPMFGWQGCHLQPTAALAQALNRGDGYGGGILLFIATHDRESIEQRVKALGFRVEVWENGSPAP